MSAYPSFSKQESKYARAFDEFLIPEEATLPPQHQNQTQNQNYQTQNPSNQPFNPPFQPQTPNSSNRPANTTTSNNTTPAENVNNRQPYSSNPNPTNPVSNFNSQNTNMSQTLGPPFPNSAKGLNQNPASEQTFSPSSNPAPGNVPPRVQNPPVDLATANAYSFDDIIDDGDDDFSSAPSKKGSKNVFGRSSSSMGFKGRNISEAPSNSSNSSKANKSGRTSSMNSTKKGIFSWGRKKNLKDDFNGDDDDFDGFSMINEPRVDYNGSSFDENTPNGMNSGHYNSYNNQQQQQYAQDMSSINEIESVMGRSRYPGLSPKFQQQKRPSNSNNPNMGNNPMNGFSNFNGGFSGGGGKKKNDQVEGALDIGMNQITSLRDRDRYGGIHSGTASDADSIASNNRTMSLRSMSMTNTSFDTTPIIPLLTTSISNGVSEKNNKYRQKVASNQLKMLKEEVGQSGQNQYPDQFQQQSSGARTQTSGPMPLGGMGGMDSVGAMQSIRPGGPMSPRGATSKPGPMSPQPDYNQNQGMMRRAVGRFTNNSFGGPINAAGLPNGGRSMTLTGYPPSMRNSPLSPQYQRPGAGFNGPNNNQYTGYNKGPGGPAGPRANSLTSSGPMGGPIPGRRIPGRSSLPHDALSRGYGQYREDPKQQQQPPLQQPPQLLPAQQQPKEPQTPQPGVRCSDEEPKQDQSDKKEGDSDDDTYNNDKTGSNHDKTGSKLGMTAQQVDSVHAPSLDINSSATPPSSSSNNNIQSRSEIVSGDIQNKDINTLSNTLGDPNTISSENNIQPDKGDPNNMLFFNMFSRSSNDSDISKAGSLSNGTASIIRIPSPGKPAKPVLKSTAPILPPISLLSQEPILTPEPTPALDKSFSSSSSESFSVPQSTQKPSAVAEPIGLQPATQITTQPTTTPRKLEHAATPSSASIATTISSSSYLSTGRHSTHFRKDSVQEPKNTQPVNNSARNSVSVQNTQIADLSLQNAALLDEVRLVTMELAESVQREFGPSVSSTCTSSSTNSESTSASSTTNTTNTTNNTNNNTNASLTNFASTSTSAVSSSNSTPLTQPMSPASTVSENNVDKLVMDHKTRAKLVVQMETALDLERRKRKALEDRLSSTEKVS